MSFWLWVPLGLWQVVGRPVTFGVSLSEEGHYPHKQQCQKEFIIEVEKSI